MSKSLRETCELEAIKQILQDMATFGHPSVWSHPMPPVAAEVWRVLAELYEAGPKAQTAELEAARKELAALRRAMRNASAWLGAWADGAEMRAESNLSTMEPKL